MSDPTQTSDVSPEPDTRDAPRAAEPLTATAGTGTHDPDPGTFTGPAEGRRDPIEPFAAPPGFDILRELGSGGMGVVYEARQTKLNRLVALKVLRDTRADAKDVLRFLSEAEAVAAVKHPHVVQVFEFGQDAGRPYMALELLTGGTLSDRLRAGKLEPRAAAELVAKLADAVQHAHDLGIVHRDLKPSNVLFSVDNGQKVAQGTHRGSTTELTTDHSPQPPSTPKITDFGLAKRTGGIDLTRTQAVMGTPAYMAPEQARGETKFVGPAADVWALGAILYECLTGKRAFDADDTWAILRKVTDELPARPRSHVPGLPRDLELIAMKCLEKSPAERYTSAAALADDLQRYLDGKPVSVRPASTGERFVKMCRRNPVVASFSTALLLVALLGFAGVTWALLKAEDRGEQLAKSNDDLNTTLGDLTRVNADLTGARNIQAKTYEVLKNARDGLVKNATALMAANEEAGERGYLSDVALAHQLWKANDLVGMRAALERCPEGRRRWEWHYLNRLSRPERDVYPTNSLPLALAYSPDGKLLAYLTMAGTLTVRDTATGKEAFQFTTENLSGRNRAIAFRPDGKELAFVIGSRQWIATTSGWVPKELTQKGSRNPAEYVAVGYTKAGSLQGAVKVEDYKTQKTRFVIRNLADGKEVASLDAWTAPKGIMTEMAGAAFNSEGTRFTASGVDSGIRVGNANEVAKFEPFKPVVMVWEVESKKLLASVPGGGSLFGGLAFDPFGRGVGFGRRGSVGLLLPEASATLSTSLNSGHNGEVLAVAFDLKNLLVWSGGDDKLVRGHGWLDNGPGEERFVLRGCGNGILRLAVSPDGKEIAAAVGDFTGGKEAVVRFDVAALAADVWRAPVGRDRISLVTALAPDGSRFAACDFSLEAGPEQTRFVIRNTAGGPEEVTNAPGMWMFGVFHPGGGLVMLDRNKQLTLTDAKGKPGESIPFPKDFGQGYTPVVGCTPDGRTLFAVAAMRAEKPPLPGRPFAYEVRFGRFSAPLRHSGQTVVRARLATWDAQTRQPGIAADLSMTDVVPADGEGASLFPTSAVTDREGKRLVSTFMIAWQAKGGGRLEYRGGVAVWDLATGIELFRRITDEPLRAAAFSPDGRLVTAGGSPAGGIVVGWNLDDGKEVLRLQGHTRPILALAFGPHGRLATGGMDRVVKLWDVKSGREMLTLDGFAREVTHLTFTGDGKNLVAGTGLDMVAAMMATGLPTEWPPAEVRTFRGPK